MSETTPELKSETRQDHTRKIALEEHFLLPEFKPYFETTAINISPELFGRAFDALHDFGDRRLEAMDAGGIDMSILSLAGPGVQVEADTKVAIQRATECNDFLAEKMRDQPRFGGLAHLPMQEPAAACRELERCMTELGYQGAMINGATNGVYLDDDRYSPFWECAQSLGAPVYIHPSNPTAMPPMYDGHSELYGPVWSWTVETANHALRLVFGGVFDRFPDAKLVLGHMGETLPYQLWRFDSRWKICNAGERTLKLAPSDYFRRNMWITTSGACSDEPLKCALAALGEDRVLFSVDYPFEQTLLATQWIEQADISTEVRHKVCSENAKSLFGLAS